MDHRILKSDDTSEFDIDGNIFTSQELRGIILISEKETPYHFESFLRFWFHHILQLLFSFAALPFILILECGNIKILYNMQFIGKSMFVMLQGMVSMFILAANIFWVKLYYEASRDPYDEIKFNIMDHIYWITLVLVRAFVIATKYGIYSPEHFKIYENIRVNQYLTTFDLISVTHKDRSIFNLYDRLLLVSKWLKIDMKEFNFLFKEEQLKGFERLRNTKEMVKYYQEHGEMDAKPLVREKLTSDNTKPWHKINNP